MGTGGIRNIWDSFKVLLGIVALLWVILVVGMILPLHEYGIRPRTLAGLSGILFAPFIHSGIDHLVANSISLIILGSVFLSMERKLSVYLLLQIMLLGGLGTWLIGRSNYVHIGASGIIYGILGYLLTIGIFKRSFGTIAVSLAVFLLYGGAVWGIFPSGGFVSWESHLCGFIAGIVTARTNARNGYISRSFR